MTAGQKQREAGLRKTWSKPACRRLPAGSTGATTVSPAFPEGTTPFYTPVPTTTTTPTTTTIS
jgi:hypothetical protein